MSTAPGPPPPKGPRPGPGVSGVGVTSAVIAAVTALVLGGVALTLWRSGGREFPVVPWLGIVSLLLASALVLVCGWRVRRSVLAPGPTTYLPSPQWARGALVAAQACALGGAVLLGWYLANVGVHLANIDVPSVRDLVWRAVASAAAALVVTVSGFVAQAWCRLPPVDDDEERRRRDPDGLAYG